MPGDRLYRQLADKLSSDILSRNHLTEGIYRPGDKKEALAALDACFAQVLETKTAKTKIKKALGTKALKKSAALYEDALAGSVITEEEYDLLKRAAAMSEAVVQVDVYKTDDYLARK